MQEAAGGVVALHGIPVRAQQFCQRQAGTLGFHVPEGNVDRGDSLHRHSAAANGSACPQQFGVDFVNIIRIFTQQVVGDLFGMSVNPLTTGAF